MTTEKKRWSSGGYSRAFTPHGETGKRYMLDAIPAGLWTKVREKAKKDGISLRALILASDRPSDRAGSPYHSSQRRPQRTHPQATMRTGGQQSSIDTSPSPCAFPNSGKQWQNACARRF